MHALRTISVLIAAAGFLVACGDDDDTSPADSTPPASEVVTTTAAAVTTTAAEEVTTTTAAAGLEQPAIWPAADVVFATPEEAASDFVTQVLGVPPTLGEFQQGDSRSGEIEIFSPAESGGTPIGRGVLFLRQLGPDDGWFLIGIGNDEASITVPEPGAEVAAGPLDVEGISHGFEASATVSAMVAGDASAVLDSIVVQAGSMEEAGPYAVSLDLSDAAPGDMVMLLVRGGVGLETDPGELGAIPVVIAG